jgi:hypothetical protein
MLHHTLYTSLFMFLPMPWNGKLLIPLWVNGNFGTVHSWKHTHTHTHTHSLSIHCIHYTLYFTVYLQKSTTTEANRSVMWWYAQPNQNIIMKGWVKLEDSSLYHTTNDFPKWVSPAICKRHDIISTYHCAHLSENYDTTWRMLPMTSCVSPYIPCTYDHLFLMQTINVH